MLVLQRAFQSSSEETRDMDTSKRKAKPAQRLLRTQPGQVVYVLDIVPNSGREPRSCCIVR